MSAGNTSSKTPSVKRGLIDVVFEETKITHIDGQNGYLAHRGYPIETLVNQPYERVAQMLLDGHWPTDEEASAFRERLVSVRELPGDLVDLIKKLVHLSPDVTLQTVVSTLSAQGDAARIEDWSLLSLMPSIVVAHSALRDGLDIPEPIPSLGLAADCLQRLVRRPLTDLEQHVINLDFVLHADHGANASAFVARVAKSALADTCRCLAAGIATFSGARHGGAVLGVIEMLDELGDKPDDCRRYVSERMKANLPIFGFGHRVYRVEDPRATLFRSAAEALSAERDDWTALKKLDAVVDAMKPFQRGGISPNVDLYAAAVYMILGVKADQAIALFAIARSAGWLAQVREQAAGSNLLIRPRLAYKGYATRSPGGSIMALESTKRLDR